MLRGKGEERCTWYMAGNRPGLDRRVDAGLAVDVMELLQEGNVRAKGNKTYHLVISFHPEDRRLTPAELEDVVRRTVRAAGLDEHQYIAVRHSEQEHEHLHVVANRIHPETLKIHHPYTAIRAYQAPATMVKADSFRSRPFPFLCRIQWRRYSAGSLDSRPLRVGLVQHQATPAPATNEVRHLANWLGAFLFARCPEGARAD